jgi:hypothetical protein
MTSSASLAQKGKSKGKFEIKTLGAPKFILSIQLDYNRERRILTLSQDHYIDWVLEELGSRLQPGGDTTGPKCQSRLR